MIDIRNARYNGVGSIDCEIDHPEFGWIPFTASPEDCEEFGRDVYAHILSSGLEVGEYVSVPPEPEPIPQKVTRRQGRLALLETGYLDQVETMISAIADPVERRAAEIEYEADTWERSNAFLQQMWSDLGGTSEALDDLFVLASTK